MHCSWHTGSASPDRVEQGEVGGVTRRVLCTWQLLGLGVKGPWLTPGGLILSLAARAGLENTTLTFQGMFANRGCFPTENADYCMLVNQWACLR